MKLMTSCRLSEKLGCKECLSKTAENFWNYYPKYEKKIIISWGSMSFLLASLKNYITTESVCVTLNTGNGLIYALCRKLPSLPTRKIICLVWIPVDFKKKIPDSKI